MEKSPFSVLKVRNYSLVWFGSFFSNIGDQMLKVAIAWQLYELTHSALFLGFIGIAGFLPLTLFSLIGGMTADKLNRRNLIILCQFCFAVLSIILFITTITSQINPIIIYTILTLSATINAFNVPAKQSLLPSLVPKEIFVKAVSLNTIQRQFGIIIGPAVAGFMIAFSGVRSVYLFSGLAFLIPTLLLFLVKIANVQSRDVLFNLKSVNEGVSFIKNSPLIYSTMFLDFLATFFAQATILMPIFAKDILKVGVEGLGFLYSAPSVGGVIAGLLLSSVYQIKNQGKTIIWAIIIYGMATLGFGFSTNFYLSLIFLGITGFADMISTIVRNTARQIITPDHLRGRMTSINMIFFDGGPKLGDAEGGLLANVVGAPASVAIGGIGTILITLLIARYVPALRKYQGNEVV